MMMHNNSAIIGIALGISALVVAVSLLGVIIIKTTKRNRRARRALRRFFGWWRDLDPDGNPDAWYW